MRGIPSLTAAEKAALEHDYRYGKTRLLRQRSQTVLLAYELDHQTAVGRAVRCSRATVNRTLQRYRRGGRAAAPRPDTRRSAALWKRPLWRSHLSRAMEAGPRACEVPRPTWTAPLLARYLTYGCDACHGRGTWQERMAFLPSVSQTCDACGGTGYRREVAGLVERDRTLADIEAQSITELLEEWGDVDAVRRAGDAAVALGIGYLIVRQPGWSLSGGEAQRLKLAKELARRTKTGTLYVLDRRHVRRVDGLQSDAGPIRPRHGLCSLLRPLVIAHHVLQRQDVTPVLRSQRRRPLGVDDPHPDRDHPPAVGDGRRHRLQVEALLLRNGDKVVRCRAAPLPDLAAEYQGHCEA